MAVIGRNEITIADLNDGQDGQNVIQLLLTNENHTLTADSSGAIISYAGATTTASVYDGATDVTSQYTIARSSSSGITTSISGATISVTNVSNGVGGTVTITATKGTKVLTKVFAISVSKAGADGSSGAAAKAVTVNPSSQVFKSTTGATGTFTPQYIYLYPSFQGGVTYSKWQYSTDGTTWNNVTSGSNSLTIGTYNSVANSLRIERTCNLYTSSITAISFKCISSDANYYDTETVIKVYDVTDIQVGGRNFILRSDFVGKTDASGTGYSRTFSDGEVTFTNTELGISNIFGLQLSDYAKSNLRGATITVSMEYMVTDTLVYGTTNPWVGFELSIYRNESTGGSSQYVDWQGSKSIPTNITNTWVRTSNTRTITDFDFSGIILGVYFRDVTGTIKLRHPKIEIGNVATDWTLAPEDFENQIEDLNTQLVEKTSDFITGTQTAATRFWTGVADFGTLEDGQQIFYWLPYATAYTNADTRVTGIDVRTSSTVVKPAGTLISSFEAGTGYQNDWLNLTLADGSETGWIPCYYGGTSRLTSHYSAGNNIHLTYKVNTSVSGVLYTGWYADANYNSDTYDRTRFNQAIKAGQAYITNSRLIASNDVGYAIIVPGLSFRIDKPILYAASDITRIGTGTNNYLMYTSVNLANTITYTNFPPNVKVNTSTKWYAGTAITGTNTTGTVFSGSGITSAVSNSSGTYGDYYTNTSTYNVYKCTLGGNAATAKWAYVENTVKQAGEKWYSGDKITGTSTTATVFSGSGISSAGVGDYYLNTSTGYYYECTLAGNASTAKWVYKGILLQKDQAVYLRGTFDGNMFTVDRIPFTTVQPTTDDGLYYMSIGVMYSNYQCGLFPEHPMYKFLNGKFESLDRIGYGAQVNLDNLEIGGTNILRGSEKPTSDYYTKVGTVVSGATFKTCSVEKTNAAWGGIGFNFRTQVEERNFVQAGDTFTFSVWARTDETTKTIKADITADGTLNGEGGTANRFIPTREVMGDSTITSVWKQFYYTFTVPANRLAAGNGSIESTRIEQNTACTDGCYVYWACPKLETGNKPTDWSPSPEDIESNVIAQLANESYTFPADSNGVPQVATLEVPVYGFKGTTQVATSIGTITGAPTGMTTYISGQSTTSNKFTISIATTLTSVDKGELTIPITVEDVTINKKFTWAKSIAGADGTPASLVTISPSALFFKSTDGATYDPNYIYLYPYFTNTTYSKWEYSTNGTTWNSVSSGSHGLNIGTYNSVANTLRVTCTSDLYTNSIPQVSFRVTATNNGTSYYDITSLARLKDGQNGESAYLHIKYSDDGINFTANSGDTPGQYIGLLVDNNPTASMTFSDYTWKKFTEDFTADTSGTGYLPLAKSAGQPMLELYIEGKTYQPTTPTWADPVQPQFVSKDNVLTMVSLNANRLNPRQLALSLVSGSTVYGTSAEATPLENGLRVTSTAAGTGTATMAGIIVQNPEDLLGKVVRISTTMYKSASNNPYLRLTWYNTASGSVSTTTLTYLDATGSKTYTVPSSFASGYNSLIVVMYSAYSGTGAVGNYTEYTDLTLHLESDMVDYEQFQALQSDVDLGYSELCSLPDGTKNTLTITNNRNIYWCPIGQYKFNGTETWSMTTKTNTYVFTNTDVKSSYTNGYSNYSTYASGTADSEHFNISASGLNVYFPKNFSYTDSDNVSHNVNSAESFALYLSYLNSVGTPFYVLYKLQAPKSLVLENCSVLTEYGTGILRPKTYDATNMAVSMSGTYFIQTDVSEVFVTNNDLLNYQTVKKALADIQTIEDTISTFAQTYVTTGTLNEAITNSKTTQEKFTSDSVSLLTTYVRDALGSIEDVEKIVNGTNIIDMSATTDKTKSASGLTISVYPDDVLGYRIKVDGTATADVVFKLYGTGSGAPSNPGPSLKAGDAYSVYGLVPGVSLTVSTWDSSSGSSGAYAELFTRNSSQSSSYFTPTDLTTADYIYLTFASGSVFDEVSFVPRFCSGVALSANMSILQSYINWSGEALWIGKSTSSVRMKLENNKLSFLSGQDEVAYISNSTLFITDATVQLVQRLGKPSLGYWESRFNETTRNLNIKWVGPTQA